MTCPRCSVAELSPLTGICELCGYASETSVAVAPADATIELARRQLAHEFEFEEPIGRGASSIVFRAREKGSKRAVILKVLPRRTDEPDAEESFRSTLDAFSGFDHPHLVPILRYGSTDSLFWYAMEPLNSTSLRELLRERRRMGPRSCRRIITQVVSALEYLHRRGVVHGAIKPENVFVDKEGWVHLCDPTFIRPRRPRPDRLTPVRATPVRGVPAPKAPEPLQPRAPWIAPEEYERGERLPAADQYALAVLIYESLSGRLPADPPEPLHRAKTDIPPSVAHAVDRALASDPWRRFPSCADFLWAIEESANAAPEARPTGRVTQDVVLIKDWEPPADPWRPLVVVGRVLVGLVTAAVLWFSAPVVMKLLRPPSGPVSVARPAASAPYGAPTTSVAPAPPPTTATTPPASVPRRQERPAPSIATGASTSPSTGSARLFINSTPWGQLYVDGTLIGNTPKADLELSAGAHALRIVRTGFATFERTVRVSPGETLRMTDIVLVPTRP